MNKDFLYPATIEAVFLKKAKSIGALGPNKPGRSGDIDPIFENIHENAQEKKLIHEAL